MEACVSPAHRRQLPEKWEASPARAGSSHLAFLQADQALATGQQIYYEVQGDIEQQDTKVYMPHWSK